MFSKNCKRSTLLEVLLLIRSHRRSLQLAVSIRSLRNGGCPRNWLAIWLRLRFTMSSCECSRAWLYNRVRADKEGYIPGTLTTLVPWLLRRTGSELMVGSSSVIEASHRPSDCLCIDLKALMGKVAYATSLFDQDGISVRFMNSRINVSLRAISS
jgi:hypothetical protein